MLPDQGFAYRRRLRHLRHKGYQFGDECTIGRNVLITGHATMGKGFHVGSNTVVSGMRAGVVIGDHVMIGPNCVVLALEYCFDDLGVPMILHPCREDSVVIGDDVWIGSNSTVTAGVRIEEGSIVGANAVAVKNVAPFTVYQRQSPDRGTR